MTLGQLLPLKVELGQGIERREGGEEVVATDAVSRRRGKARLCGGHADDQDKQLNAKVSMQQREIIDERPNGRLSSTSRRKAMHDKRR